MGHLSSQRVEREKRWFELCCLGFIGFQLPWMKAVLRKWVDTDVEDPEDFSAYDEEESENETVFEASTSYNASARFSGQRSEVLHVQYANRKEVRICVGTWNVGGRTPPDGLDIKEWLAIEEPADIYVLGHLTSGANDRDHIQRNSNVQNILQRTKFHFSSEIPCPRSIHDHERIIWLGDLNYRIKLSYDDVQDLIIQNNWSKLAEMDQLRHELEKGGAFDGWVEGILGFPPTYKYGFGSDNYIKDDPKNGKRTPAWCDRILSFGKGIRLLKYKRSELNLSDHRPVTAIYAVEVLSHRKFQRVLSTKNVMVEDCLVRHMDDVWQGTT